ncbi:MAG: AfsR/SARP family transcriptional regulator [Micromonosporaceae bacterium]
MLWPEATASRAVANLRSVLWRLGKGIDGVIEATHYDLRLGCRVLVDIGDALAVARELLDRSSELDVQWLRQAVRCNLYDDLVPDLGDDDWLDAERERFQQLRVHSLETLADRLIAVGWHGAAIEAALGAIRTDPFRESAYDVLVRAYLAEGSYLEARQQHMSYCRLLQRELRMEPSARFMHLLDDLCVRGSTPGGAAPGARPINSRPGPPRIRPESRAVSEAGRGSRTYPSGARR